MYVLLVSPPIGLSFRDHWLPLVLLDVSVTLPPAQNVVGPPGVIVGVSIAVTLSVNVVVAVAPAEFVTVRVKVELVARQVAPTLAVTLPAASMPMLSTVKPVPAKGVAVTVNVFA